MYNVSSNYITAVRSTTRDDKLTGTLAFSDNTTQSLTDTDFDDGSVGISRSCVEGEELMFGSVIMAELDMSIRTEKSRYAFYGAEVELTYSVKIGTNTWEDVPLGVFNIAESDRVGKLVKIVAYDNLSKLDLTYDGTILAGTPFNIIRDICTKTGLELGMEYSDMSSWPNADQTIQIDSSNECNTFRACLKAVCQLVGAFAVADRTGKLVLRRFATTSCQTLTEHHRYSLTAADYVCNYIAVDITSVSGTYTSSITGSSGLVMTIDDAPAWDYGLETVLNTRATNLLTYLNTISYTPCDMNMPGDPAFDCGDRLTLSIGDDTVYTLITSIDWKYHGSMDIGSVGANPYLVGTTSETEKDSRILSQQTNANELSWYNFENTEDIEIAAGSTSEIASIEFATNQSTQVLFNSSIALEVEPTSSTVLSITTNATFYDEDGNAVAVTGTANAPGYVDVEVTYKIDNVTQDFKPKEHLVDGKHILTLILPIASVSSQARHKIQVLLTATNGSITINENDIKSVLFGQNLVAGTGGFDGDLDVEDTFTTFQLQPIGFYTITDTVTDVLETIIPVTLTDTFTRLTLTPISFYTITDSVSNIVIRFSDAINTARASRMSYSSSYVSTEDDQFALKTEYTFTSAEATIDSGRMTKLDINTSQFTRVDDLEVRIE